MIKLTDHAIGGYERVVRATDSTTGLDACIAIHDTQLGPAIGGCRYMEYKDFDEQRYDALRLSKQMTYKNTLAGLHYGGGKTTINARAGKKSPEFWKSFAEVLDRLNGIYYTAGDIGTTQDDLLELHKHTQYALGYRGKDSGWATAYGVYNSITGAFNYFAGFDNNKSRYTLLHRSVAIVGLGKVGSRLAHFLTSLQPSLTVYAYDIDKQNYDKAKERFNKLNFDSGMTRPRLQWCDSIEEINQLPVDIYAPCATGGMITEQFASKTRAKIICGGANNQLLGDASQILKDRKILYVPDYLANSGGIVQVCSSYNISHDITTSLKTDWDHPLVKEKLENIGLKVYDLLSQSKIQNKPTNIVAKEIVEGKLKNL